MIRPLLGLDYVLVPASILLIFLPLLAHTVIQCIEIRRKANHVVFICYALEAGMKMILLTEFVL